MIDPWMTLVSLIPLLLLPPVTVAFGSLIHERFGRIQEQLGLMSTMAQENLAGQRIVKQVVASLESRGATPIEVDTDGVYFVPPASVETAESELALVEDVASDLPPGIRLSHDGSFAGMLSLRERNR